MDTMMAENKAALMDQGAENQSQGDALLMLDAGRLRALGLARELKPGDQVEIRGQGRVLDAGQDAGATLELRLTGLALTAAGNSGRPGKDGPGSDAQEAFFRTLFGEEG